MGYARKDVEKTKKIAKKFVRYQEGSSVGIIILPFSSKCILTCLYTTSTSCILLSKSGSRFSQ